MKHLLAIAAPALIALCFAGLVAAQSPPAAPTGVTVFPSGEGVLVSWDSNDAVAHWVAWMNDDEYQAASAAGDWTAALNYEYVPSGDTHVVAKDLVAGDDYWFIVGSADRQNPSAVAWGAWKSVTAIGPIAVDDDTLTREYVAQAIAYHDANGRDATVTHYRSDASIDDGRSLTLLDADTGVLLVYHTIPTLQGQYVGPGSTFSGFQGFLANATAEGQWITTRAINPVTKQEEPRRIFFRLHGGLVFVASHSALVEDVAAATKEYVNKAIDYYNQNGLLAVESYYNRLDSLDGQFYLFVIDENDSYIVHPIQSERIGMDIKDVVGSDGQRLGEEIAQATEDGIWVEYLWPHPVTEKEMQKVTWAVRHDGLIFASGYYVGGSETETPPWQDADPREYTVQYVNRAIERYERDGLESLLNYYNSVASFEGEWYLFATDANDVYHVHPLLPHLIGTDIKDVVGSDGYRLGQALAAAEDGGEGVWVEYLWPHPVTEQEVPKVGYAVRKDGMLFASGYYPQVDDPAGSTRAYVQKAIDYYKANGLDATVAHYKNPDSVNPKSVDGQWNLTLADKDDTVLVAILSPRLVGTDLKTLGAGRTRQIGKEMAAATEGGLWVSYVWPNTRSSETLYAHTWAIRYEGLLFSARYYDDQPDVPAEAQPSGQVTRKYVMDAIAYYNSNGLEATVEHYNDTKSIENRRYLILLDDADATILAMSIFQGFRGEKFPFTEHFQAVATETGDWIEHQGFYLIEESSDAVAPGPMRSYVIRHNGLIFMSGHSILSENVAVATQDYVERAIAYYRENGLPDTIERYGSFASLEGHFYLFLIGPDDLYLAHPIFPGLIGTDIKDVKDGAGDPLGERIALATEQGVWVEYLWPNPITRIEEPKTTWAKRYDGMIFASGYYEPDPDAPPPAWQNVADPEQYTEDYVNRAIELYERDGLESMKTYYNSVASFEGQWYLFATDADDIYHVHPLLPQLIGTNINDRVGDDGYELGKELAKAVDGGEGVWVDYLWPHPVTLQKVPKRGYAVRHDGMLFASGYYPELEDPAGGAQAYVQKAMDYFDAHGLEETLAHYGSLESIEGQYVLLILDEQGVVQVFTLLPEIVGWDVSTFKGPVAGEPVGEWLLSADEEGHWFDYLYPNVSESEVLRAHQWAIRHDGYIFSTAYFVEQGQPGPAD